MLYSPTVQKSEFRQIANCQRKTLECKESYRVRFNLYKYIHKKTKKNCALLRLMKTYVPPNRC